MYKPAKVIKLDFVRYTIL